MAHCLTVVDEERERIRTAWNRVYGVRDAVRERFTVDWGVELPESIFRFWAFMLSLGPDERQAMEYMELGQARAMRHASGTPTICSSSPTKALGRHPLAGIVAAHHRHRHLPFAGVL